MKYRIKSLHYKNESRYYPQWKLLWFWVDMKDKCGCYPSFSSKIKAQKFIDDDIDRCNPKIEYIPYEV